MAADIRPAARPTSTRSSIENRSFSTDRMSRQSFRRLIARRRPPCIVASAGTVLAGYCVVLFRAGSAAARLYSLAVDPAFRGLGRALIAAAERARPTRLQRSLRLEVREDNVRAITSTSAAYSRLFGAKPDYYADGATALRFEKPLAPQAAGRTAAGTAAA